MTRHVSLLPDGRSPFLGPIYRPGQGRPLPGLSSDAARFHSLSDLAWLPSDLTGLFTTATGGTNPVPGDPVGLMLNCSQFGGKTAAQYMAANGITDPTLVPGKHFKQTTAGARPILARYPKSGVRNRLLWTEDFSNAAWVATVVGTSTRTNIANGRGEITATSANGGIRQVKSGLESGQVYTLSFYLESSTPTISLVLENGSASYGQGVSAIINPSTGAASSVVGFTSITSKVSGNGRIYECVLPAAGGSLIAALEWRIPTNGGKIIFGTPQLEAASAKTNYQRVTNAYDVTEVPYAHCYVLVGDGLSKCMVTDAVTPGTDKVTVVAGVRKLSDATAAIVLESSVTKNSNNGVFAVLAPGTSLLPGYHFASKGTAEALASVNSGYAAPISSVVTGIGDIGNDVSILRINGIQVASISTDQGSGNYGSFPLFLMARNQSSTFFNGWFAGASIKWNHHAAADQAFLERFLASKTPEVTL